MTSTENGPYFPEVGDVVTQEPYRTEGLILVDGDGDRVTYDGQSWRRDGVRYDWDEIFEYEPITVLSVPQGYGWVEVRPEDLTEGDEIRVLYPQDDEAPATVQGVVTGAHGNMVYLRNDIEVPLKRGETVLRRPGTPEPGPGAVWADRERRYFNTGARDAEGAYIWTTPGDPTGSYDWADIRTRGGLRELLAAGGAS